MCINVINDILYMHFNVHMYMYMYVHVHACAIVCLTETVLNPENTSCTA